MNKSFATFFQETGFGADQKVRQHFFGHFWTHSRHVSNCQHFDTPHIKYVSIFEFYPKIHLETHYSGARTQKYFFE